MSHYAELAAKLRVYKREDYQRLRSTLYNNLDTILAALDLAACVTLADLIRMAEAEVQQ